MNWEKTIYPEYVDIIDLKFIDHSTAFFIVMHHTGHSYLYQTTDTLRTWSQISAGDQKVYAYFISESGSWYITLEDSLSNHYIQKSLDNGETWTELFSFRIWRMQQMYFRDDETGIACFFWGGFWGPNQLILTNFNDPGQWQARYFSYNLSDIIFNDHSHGLAYGGYSVGHFSFGDIFFTSDGGCTWSPDNAFTGHLQACSFPNDSIGYLLTSASDLPLYKSTDAGRTWAPVYIDDSGTGGVEFSFVDLLFETEHIGYAIGRWEAEGSGTAYILKTENGGNLWKYLWSHEDNEDAGYGLTALDLKDNTIWAVGSKGLIVRWSDSDPVRIVRADTDISLHNVCFSDSLHGWAAGGFAIMSMFFHVLISTKDGGITWEVDAEFPYVINEIFFKDTRRGWMVGCDSTRQGIILATDDGGESWIPKAEHLPAPLNGLYFIGDYGWAVGEHGLVLKTENGGVNWIDARNEITYPASFKLNQNYPNPFNPITVISWQLAVNSQVELTVYNVLGEKLATLVSKRMHPGNHRYLFDGGNLASGVYYYQLAAGEYRVVKKMILLR